MQPSRKPRFFTKRDLEKLPALRRLGDEHRFAMRVVAEVLPFRVNDYVMDQLIDWSRVPEDPIFQLTFPQPGMLESRHFERIATLLRRGRPAAELRATADAIRLELEPHPAGQMSANVPTMDHELVPGVQHKYRETCLVFPAKGQTCHAYCSFCFRWPQFVGMSDLKFATDEAHRFAQYIASHKELSDVLFTGGDPMVMSAENLRAYIEPLLRPEFEHIRTIRIGSKSLSYWPYRYTQDEDADAVLRLFERVVESGKHLAFMAHLNHWAELSTPVVREAIARIRGTGAEIRAQAPVIRYVNDDAEVWARLWQTEVELGVVPYYMFVERNTGAQHYFALPLVRALEIYRGAIQRVSGLARTARGPSMSATPGKVAVEGVATVGGEEVFVLSFLQGRRPDWVKRPFFAKFNPDATWLDQLEPAFGEERFFFEEDLDRLLRARARKLRLVTPSPPGTRAG